MAVVRPASPVNRAAIAIPRAGASTRDARIFRISGLLMLLAAGVLAAGSLSPWVSYLLPSGATLSRNAFQFSASHSWTWIGPTLLFSACLLGVFGVLTFLHPFHPNLCMPLIPTMIAGLEIVDIWHGGFGGIAHATTSLGVGSFLCYAALGLGVVASLVLIPAEQVLTR